MQSASMQQTVAEEVNRRLAKATKELEEKYTAGNTSTETSADGPTGAAYKEKQAQELKAKKAAKQAIEAANEEASKSSKNKGNGEDDDDDEDDDGEDGDLRSLREERLKQIKKQHQQRLEDLSKGHGQYREITQDEFLPEVTSSTRVICHFYHREFPRCAIMDHHLQRLAARHVETKFIKINGEKAPFFVDKLTIRSMPTLVLFVDGVAMDKVLGFQGLADRMPEGKEDEWPTIFLARLLGQKGFINEEAIVDDDDVERTMKAKAEQMRKQAYLNAMSFDPNEEFSDDD